MPNLARVSKDCDEYQSQPVRYIQTTDFSRDTGRSSSLPASITKAASKQTYYTIRFLVDRNRTEDAYRAYAYFRWMDDWLDNVLVECSDRMAFIERQKSLIDCCYQGEWPSGVSAEEQMLVDLIRNDEARNSGLRAYIQNMTAVMTFDANRQGRLISEQELDCYSLNLAAAVTEALHHFIGHTDSPPYSDACYLAATGAHIAHMLRDTYEDVAAGYFNIPSEVLVAGNIEPTDIDSDAYRVWVKRRVDLARTCFERGKEYLAGLKNLRCRLAGYSYIARFEYVLNAIQREGYKLRPEYHERQSLSAALTMGWSVFHLMLGVRSQRTAPLEC